MPNSSNGEDPFLGRIFKFGDDKATDHKTWEDGQDGKRSQSIFPLLLVNFGNNSGEGIIGSQ